MLAHVRQSITMKINLEQALHETSKSWLVTGVAGFIGSNIALHLLESGQNVVGLDNFSTGQRRNIFDIELRAGELKTQGKNGSFRLIEGDIRDRSICQQAVSGIDFVLHQAALGSVPRSIENPLASHESNVDGFINMLRASQEAGLKRFVYASSSSVYGDSPQLPKVEEVTGSVLSPYAATKAINELYAAVFQRTYGIKCVGLRYFNVFGPRQDPNGPYAAVIPKWLLSMLKNEALTINGDGTTSRDFCYIKNVVQANLRAALTPVETSSASVYNVAYGQKTTLLELASTLRGQLSSAMGTQPDQAGLQIVHADFRPGDVMHSLANTTAIATTLGYSPTHSLIEGLAETCPWYFKNQDRLI